MVVEVYGVGNDYIPNKFLASLFTGGMQHCNPDMSPDAIKEVWTFARENHTLLNVEMPVEAIEQTLDVMIGEKMPAELTNVVVRNYQPVGEYTLTQ